MASAAWIGLWGTLLAAVLSTVLAYFLPGLVDLLHPGVDVHITNTSGEGVSYYLKPNRRGGTSGGAREGEQVRIVCQVPNGEPITDIDHPTPEQRPNDTVWDKTVDGLYFPDQWSDLPKNKPSGLPTC